ncbi:hypothetical protein GRF59_07230 [Paenibacillus sp. HJL G12]|uniref:Uncharacterized protein n=1 Tax=Paenibacillus dendrobii TaxID=2691084 RepID=A0A7X3IH42_9BACL|nr:hypothetical protein [Paenibacillus dendrobii]MWV43423.1 hypothetical protein [Paenibacillus dendrobii]
MNSGISQQKQSSIDDFTGVYPLRIIRSQTVSLLLLPNVLLLILAFADPYETLWAWMLLAPLAVLDIFGLIVLISPGRMQTFHLFFLGMLGILGSAAFTAAANKLAYATLGMSSPWFLIATGAGYFLVFGLLYRIHIKLLYGGYYSREEHETLSGEGKGLRKSQGIILACSGGGILVGSILIKALGGYNIKIMLIMLLLLLFALAYMMFANNLHKYILLKRGH